MDVYDREDYKLSRKQQADKEYTIDLINSPCKTCEHWKKNDNYCLFYKAKLYESSGIIYPCADCDEDTTTNI